jgi:hypothetical protein
MASFKELLEEFRLVFSGRNSILDSVIPPLLFIIANAVFGVSIALWVSLGGSLLITILRLFKRQPLWYALAGMGAALLAFGLVLVFKKAEAFFLPSLLNGALTIAILAGSLVLKRPAVALTSCLARRWPLNWYWHPRVRPAYSEVTLLWLVYSGVKFFFQFYLYKNGMADTLAVFNLVSGWPALIILLVISYLYGQKRLRNLKGPSIDEFKKNTPPPWEGQKRGF